ncbi:lutropin-choriogonadotropic hormone receptor [Dermacentor andersoni]|uniref:lutropin-choriogonadotropic hormone receptor n=1 Tax=Dermacentor andersoni TaxID=34620 RepID=UPI003B3ACCD0
MHDLNPSTYIGMLDFDSNRIAELTAYSIKVKAGTLILNHNTIAAIRAAAFDGSKIAELRLRGNRELAVVEDDAFYGLSNLSHLDLSETSLTKLPTRGLESLEVLELRDAPALREFPSVYHFRFIRVAHLTYPYHCCAFQFPETHDPEEHSRRVHYPRRRTPASGRSAELSRVEETLPIFCFATPRNVFCRCSCNDDTGYTHACSSFPTRALVSLYYVLNFLLYLFRYSTIARSNAFFLTSHLYNQKHCNSDDEASMNRHQKRPPAVGEEHDFQLLERFFVVQLSTKQTTTPPSRRFVRHVFSEFGTIHVLYQKPSHCLDNTMYHVRGYYIYTMKLAEVNDNMAEKEAMAVLKMYSISDLTLSAECTTATVCHQLVQCCTDVIPTPAFCASQVTCGKLASRRVQCLPAPDAFNPCEDVMGTMVLRVAVWFVVVAAVFGNLAVLLVLLSGRLTVSKFLMCNLAFADLCMGAYLLVIASEDLHTRGRYFSHAILWQHGAGCKVAGFLTVFASELSIYTLTVITLERWYAITYAVHLNRRLRLRTAARIMACGWVYALLAASLPLLGISSYSKTSICLPMENSTVADLLYLLTLLSMNGLAFLLICACYAKMYLAISGQRPRSHCGNKDTSVAKRMAMLVFTDFACWAPIAFFGLTAVAGYPLIDVPKSKILLVFFYPLNSCANPFLYAILTKQYRRDLSALLSTRGVCTRRMLKYTSSWHTTPTNRLLRNKDNSSTSRQTTELSNRTQKGSPHPIKNNFTKLGLHEEFLRRQSLLCEHLDTPI